MEQFPGMTKVRHSRLSPLLFSPAPDQRNIAIGVPEVNSDEILDRIEDARKNLAEAPTASLRRRASIYVGSFFAQSSDFGE
jgi:hypothetical protein